jgi:hypothetical protein
MSNDEDCGHDPDYMICGECCEGMEARIAKLEAQLLAASEIVKDIAGKACVCDAGRGYTCDFHRKFGADPWVHVGKQAQWARKVVAKIAELEQQLAKARAALDAVVKSLRGKMVGSNTPWLPVSVISIILETLTAIDQEPGDDRCPTCNSGHPERHPAVQHEGEVHLCRDPYHRPSAEEIEAGWRDDDKEPAK